MTVTRGVLDASLPVTCPVCPVCCACPVSPCPRPQGNSNVANALRARPAPEVPTFIPTAIPTANPTAEEATVTEQQRAPARLNHDLTLDLTRLEQPPLDSPTVTTSRGPSAEDTAAIERIVQEIMATGVDPIEVGYRGSMG